MKYSLNQKKYEQIRYASLLEAEQNSICKEILQNKNILFYTYPETSKCLVELDTMLSEYYEQLLEIFYSQIFTSIMKDFCFDE